MNLTNHKADTFSLQQSTSFSKYFAHEDRFDDYNYSESNINETLLLEATHLDSALQKVDHKKLSLLKDFKEDEGPVSRDKSLVFQLCGDSYVDNSNSSGYKVERSHHQIEDLYHICRTLVDTLSKLQNKVEKMEEKDVKKDTQKNDYNACFIDKQPQSILSYSSLQNTNGCKCDSRLTQRDVISGLFEVLHTRSKQSTYKQENQHLRKQIIRLEIANEEIKKAAKRAEADNNRLRQLLRQYQNFNKRLVGEKQFEQVGKISRNHSQKVLSERQLCHSKSNTSCFQNLRKQEEEIPFEYYNNFSTTVEQQKQNLVAVGRSISKRFEPKSRSGAQTPIENARSLLSYSGKDKRKMFELDNYDCQPRILFDPQTARGQYKLSDKDRSVKIATFEQCRQIQSANDYVLSSPFVAKAGPYIKAADKHSRTFRELKQAKLRGSKRTEY